MKVIAITGRSGSGKSTVSAYYGSLGYPVLDADRTAREAVSYTHLQFCFHAFLRM